MARIIDNLDPWANVWEDVGKSFGSGLMTGWEKGKQQKEMEELGLDFSTPESTIDSMRKLGGYYLDKGQTEDGINMLSKALAAQATLAKGATVPTKDIPTMPEAESTRISEQLDKKFDFGEGIFGIFDLGQDVSEDWEGYDRAGMTSWVFSYAQKFNTDPQSVINNIAKGNLKPADIGGTMQQPSGGGSALTGTAPPVPSIFKR
jgi:hypothetical protein